MPDCYDELTKSFKNVPQFKAFNLALGSEAGKIEMHRSEYSLSSSILPMAELHKASFPFTRNETIQEIDVVRLDDMAVELELFEPILIKLDVQGFEDKVIEGGKDVFSRANIVITEMSVEELYKGQKLFDDIYRILVDFGFVYRGNYEQLFNPHDGRVLQVDGIFVRK